MKEVIIGSGPAALACAAARIASGAQVHVLDIGDQLEPHLAQLRLSLAATSPDQWSADTLRPLRSGFDTGAAGRSLRPHFGSFYAYDHGQLANDQQDNVHVLTSRARGGLLAVWGANMVAPRWQDLSAIDGDMQIWEEALRSIARLVHLCGQTDDLAAEYPLFAQDVPPPLSQQGQLLQRHWQAHRQDLAAAHIRFGQARLAVRANRCQLCGLCLTGCPYALAFDGLAQWNAWEEAGQVTLQGGFAAVAITRRPGGGWLIHGDESSGAPVVADRVFVATGVVSTLRIAAQSWLAAVSTAQLRYHPHLLAPSIMANSAATVESERLHTMPQLLLQLHDPKLAVEPVHVQVSTYNHWMSEELVRRAPFLAHQPHIRQQLAGRLLGVQAYLHAGSAPPIDVAFQRVGGKARLHFQSANPAQLAAVQSQQRAVLAALTRAVRALGFSPLPGMVQWGRPGDGNHVGASMPMRLSPLLGETDLLGQPPGWQGIHVIDASVLPTLPAYTMTYLAMANAYRIGRMLPA
jgi:ferredoxin